MKRISYFLLIYFALRAFSFWFGPDTGLQGAKILNQIVTGAIILLVAYWLVKKDERGWYVVAGEIILGGGGGFLALGGVTLRTWLLLVSLSIFVIQKFNFQFPISNFKTIFNFKFLKNLTPNTLYLIPVSIAVACLSAIVGLTNGHTSNAIIADTIPYFFLLYYFPLGDLWKSTKFKEITKIMLFTAIIGNAIFVSFTLIGFSSGFFHLQDTYYHWFRDVALGKVTDFGDGFFRIVLNEQLLLAPLLLYLMGDLIKNKKNNFLIFNLLSLIFILSLSLTRIYLIAWVVGLLYLFDYKQWKRWLTYSAGVIAAFILIFSATHVIATRGQSLGLELLGLRLGSIAAPQLEDSALTRMLLLPKIWQQIKTAPIFGRGLGDTVTVYSPTVQANITTSQFDWGYLEIWDEMGLAGLAVWIFIIVHTLSLTIKRDKQILTAILISLLAINLTSPALFHVLGIILLTIIVITANDAWKESTRVPLHNP